VEVLFLFLLGLLDHDLVGKVSVDAAELAGEVNGDHDLDLDTHDALLEEDVSDGAVDVFVLGLAGGDEVALLVLHGLGSLLSELSGDDDLAALDLLNSHNASDHEHSGRADGSALKELGLQQLDLGRGGQGLVLDGLEVDDNVSLLEAESLFNQSLKLIAANAVLAEGDLLVDDLGGDDDLVDGVLDSDAGVAGGHEGALHEFVDFGVEDSIGDDLFLLANLSDISHDLYRFINLIAVVVVFNPLG
jgi:hypothetical protein